MHSALRIPLSALIGLTAVAGSGASLSAQVITGRVIEYDTKEPIESVHVVLMGEGLAAPVEALTDSEGRFRLEGRGSGPWLLTAERIGYSPVRSELDAQTGEEVVVEVRMAVRALDLDPLVVTGRTQYTSPALRSFYERMERGRQSGLGQFISRADIEKQRPLRPTDLFRGKHGIRTKVGPYGRAETLGMASGCIPAIFVDGSQINRFDTSISLNNHVSTYSIEGVEIYSGAGAQMGRFTDPGGCGLILVWTRRGTPDPDAGPFPWKGLMAGAGLMALLLVLR